MIWRRKFIDILLLGVSCLIFIVLYLSYDKSNYFYGYGCSYCSEKLPYNLEPKFFSEYPQRFNLLDADGFELVGGGFRYETTNFILKDFSAYAYNDTSVIVKCTDSLNRIYYLISYQTGYKSKKGIPEISFKILIQSDLENVKYNYQWIDLENTKGERIKFYRNLSLIMVLLSMLLIFRKILKLRSVKTTQ